MDSTERDVSSDEFGALMTIGDEGILNAPSPMERLHGLHQQHRQLHQAYIYTYALPNAGHEV